MKRYLLLLILIVLSSFAYSLEECKPVIDVGDSPCRVSTTYPPLNNCNTYTAQVYNPDGEPIYSVTLGSYGNTSQCSFTFNQTVVGDYPYNMSTGDTGNILVEGDEMILIMYLAVGVVFALLLFSLWKQDEHMGALSAMLAMVIGVYIWVNGFPGFNNKLTIAFGFLFIGFGAYVMAKAIEAYLQTAEGG